MLVSLKTGPFSFQVGNLIRCRTQEDLIQLLEIYSKEFANIKEKDELRHMLQKIGLSYENNILYISNPLRWSQVSMVERVKLKMPPTTNSLESLHGHLNEATPRRNNFWGALSRIIRMINQKITAFPDALQHTFYNSIKISKKRSNIIGKANLRTEIE